MLGKRRRRRAQGSDLQRERAAKRRKADAQDRAIPGRAGRLVSGIRRAWMARHVAAYSLYHSSTASRRSFAFTLL